MNERIYKLAEQAWDATAVSPDFGHPVSFAEKLSELIIQECVDIITPYSWRLPGEEYPHPISVIKDRFGIEGIKG
jgi:hypothetical protein